MKIVDRRVIPKETVCKGDYILYESAPGVNEIRIIVKENGKWLAVDLENGIVGAKANSLQELLDTYRRISDSMEVIPVKNIEIHLVRGVK